MLGMSSLSYSQIPTVERAALIALYNSTNGANWTNNSGWLGSAGTECDWYGIDCSGGKVSSILLWNNNLSGTIPSELCNLSTNVFRLILNNELGSGSLSGSIPSCLSGLTGLDQLYLQDNQLSGTIPQSILDLGIANFFTYNNNLDNVPATASITGGNRTVADSDGSAGESVTVVGTIYDHELRAQGSNPITTEWLVNGSVVSTQPGGNATNYNIGLSLSDGSNTIALRVTDYHGAVTTATVTITVQAAAANVSPTVSISGGNRTIADSDGSAGETVSFTATATDSDGTIASTQWLVGGSEVATGTSASIALDNGETVVTFKATDDDGASASTTVTITVEVPNVSPSVSISDGDRTIADTDGSAGETVSFTATATDSDGTIASTQWLVGGSEVATGTSASIALDNGETVVTFKATDDDGASASTTVTITVEVPNVSPSVSISDGDRTIADTDGSAGETVSFTATATDSDGTIASTQWLVGGSEVATGTSASIILSNGAIVVTFKATDNDGSSTTTTATITVEAPNVSPSVSISGGDRTIADTDGSAGETVSFTATATDSDGTIASTQWLVGGSEVATGTSASIILSNGAIVVTFKATDNDGSSTTTTATITVEAPNVSPSVSISGGDRTIADTDGSAGETVSFTATATDSDGTIASTQWLVGGSEVATGTSASIILSNGATVVTFKATDNDGSSTTTTATITVEAPNVSPSVSISGNDRTIADTDGSAGETVSFTATATDSDGTIASTQWLVGGSEVATGTSASIALDNGETVVTFKATDNDGSSTTTTATITVEAPNVSPSVSISDGDRTIADTGW